MARKGREMQEPATENCGGPKQDKVEQVTKRITWYQSRVNLCIYITIPPFTCTFAE